MHNQIIVLPDWNLTLLINRLTKLKKQLVEHLLEIYSNYLRNKYNTNIPKLSKVLTFSNYYSIDDLFKSFDNNDNINSSVEQQQQNTEVKQILIQSKKIGIIMSPDIYNYINYTSNNSTSNFDNYCLNLIKNPKKHIWSTNHSLQPQWYILSNTSNQSITDTIFYYNLEAFKNYIPENYYLDIVSKFKNEDFINEENELINTIKSVLNNVSYDDYHTMIIYFYQNDYFFLQELSVDFKTNDYKDIEHIKLKYGINSSKKNPVFTIITPTMGTETLYRLKQVLRQEGTPFIHLILWDNNRRVNEKSELINPEDLEDEYTFCYHFKHPYFEFKGQRNDVWLRGVGATLTNTPYVTYFDDDTWPERDHLTKVMKHMVTKNINYTYVIRRMWENHHVPLGLDNFEAIGKINKFGFRLIDNSSIYMRLEVARKVMNVFLNNQVYGDDRFTPDFLNNDPKCKGERMEKVLVNHIAKPILLNYFKENVTPEV
jgi:hypothetical protein